MAVGHWLARVLAPLHVCRTIWSMRPLTAVAMVLLVAGPWYTWVGLETSGQWLVGFFGVHNFGRFTGAMDNHSGPIFYYLVAIAMGFFPWSVLATPTLLTMKKQLTGPHPWHAGYVLVCAWIAVWVGFFSLAGTKLPSYIIPAYPALALLTACFVASWIREPSTVPRLYIRLAWGCVALTGIGLCIALPIVAHLLLDDQWYLGAVGLIPLAAAVVGWIYSERSQTKQASWALAGGGIVTWLVVFAILAPQVDQYQDGPVFAARIAADSHGQQPTVRSFHHFRPSHVFYTHGIVEKIDSPEQVRDFFAAHIDGAFVITNEGQFDKLRGELPEGIVVLESRRRLGLDENVLLLGRRTADSTARSASPSRR